jgi:hypothetical protein
MRSAIGSHRCASLLSLIALATLVAVTLASAAVLPPAAPGHRASAVKRPSPCLIPRLLGLERDVAEAELKLYAKQEAPCRSLKLAHVTIRHTDRHGAFVVVSQTPGAFTTVRGRRDISITVTRSPPLPRDCRLPTLYRMVLETPQLISWEVRRSGVGDAQTGEIFACVRPLGPKRLITEVGVALYTLIASGHFMAFINDYGSRYSGGESIIVDDVLGGATSEIQIGRLGAAGDAKAPPEDLAKLGEPVGTGAAIFALGPGGELAWVGRTASSAGDPAQFVLYLRDADGTRKLAVSAEIDGVAFDGSELTWEAAGVAAAAPA